MMKPPDKIYMREEVMLGHKGVKRNGKDRKNPNSLRFVIAHILNYYYGSRAQAAKYLAEEKSRYHKNNYLDDGNLGEILRDESYIQYWQLECIAKHIGIPTGSLLDFSRLYSLIQKGEQGNADEFVKSMRRFADWLEGMNAKGTISKPDIEEWIACFSKLSKLDDSLV